MLDERDVEEVFLRSSGPGGQNVNKVATAVCLRHRPSGLQVKCQRFRTQHQNRMHARQLLSDLLMKKAADELSRKISAREKERRKRRKRPKALKERILCDKKHRAQRKSARRVPSLSREDL